MTEQARTVTVAIATRDRLPLLQQAVASALAQSTPPTEVLVVDDGSTDGTAEWLRSAAAEDSRIVGVTTPPRGVGPARQLTLERASGSHVCVLDSDDRLLPDALAGLTAVLDEGADVAYGDMLEHGADGSGRLVRFPRYPSSEAMLASVLTRPRVPFKHSGFLLPRRAVLELGGYDADLPLKVDVDLVLRMLAAGWRLGLAEEPVVEFLVHADSLSARRVEGARVWRDLIRRYGPPAGPRRQALLARRTAIELAKGTVGRLPVARRL